MSQKSLEPSIQTHRELQADAYITVYLSLSLSVLLTLILMLLQGAAIKTIRFKTECVMDAGLESIFAEYHRELLKQYGLLFIDSSYGTAVAGIDKTKGRLMHYLKLNFEDNGYGVVFKDLTATRADNAVLSNISYATDHRGEVLRYQIDRYMKVKYGLAYVPALMNDSVDTEGMMNQYDGYDSGR